MKTCKKISTGEIFEYEQCVSYPVFDRTRNNGTIYFELISKGKFVLGKYIGEDEFYDEYIDIKKERRLKLEKLNQILQ